MEEISQGLWHWTAPHDKIGIEVSSYYLEAERVAIDPMVPPGVLEWLEQRGGPEHILLTNRHHDRQSWQLRDAFGSTVHCIRNGVYEIEGRGPVEAFDFGDELPGGAIVYEVDAICPDETALHIPAHDAVACADGIIHYGEALGFVPDRFMDAPEDTKRKLREAYGRLVELDFDVLLTAHGNPVVGGAREALRQFAAGGAG